MRDERSRSVELSSNTSQASSFIDFKKSLECLPLGFGFALCNAVENLVRVLKYIYKILFILFLCVAVEL